MSALACIRRSVAYAGQPPYAPMGNRPDCLNNATMTRSYSPASIALHWLMAIALMAQLALGFWMVDLPKEPPGLRAGWFNWHKSIGMVLGLLVLLRLWVRWRSGSPGWPATLPRWQQRAAEATHGLLYLCMVTLPLSGLAGSSFSPYPVRFFGLALPRWTEPWPQAKAWCSTVHEASATVMLAILALHVAAALWHLLRGDGIGRRMHLPR